VAGVGGLRAARVAVAVVFFLNGFGFSNWVVRIPAVRDHLGLDKGTLGLALLGASVGSLISMPLVGGLAARFGSRPVVGVMAAGFCVVLALPGFAGGAAALALSLVVVGVFMGGLDVSMNTQAVAVERGYGRPIMSSFHAMFSLGGLAGSVVGGVAASAGVGVSEHLLGIGASMAVVVALAYRRLLPARTDASATGPAFARPTRALAGLGMIAFCVLLGEGAMADWSAVYLRGTLGTDAGFAALGYAAFSVAMAAGRFAGDRLLFRFGPRTVVRVGGLLAAVGFGCGLLLGEPVAALAGFACAGAGFATVFPAALSAAGRTGAMPSGPAVAAVSTSGYLGFLVGPPTIGFAADHVGLGMALYLIVALSAAVAVLAGTTEAGGKG